MDTKKIAVWLDHTIARFIDPKDKGLFLQTIHSELETMNRFAGESEDTTHFDNRTSSNEYRKDHREQQHLRSYYSAIAKILLEYDDMLLFGPTTAKNELKNIISEDRHFAGKNIRIENASSKETDHEILERVRAAFQPV